MELQNQTGVGTGTIVVGGEPNAYTAYAVCMNSST
jgi:hypothetical protein